MRPSALVLTFVVLATAKIVTEEHLRRSLRAFVVPEWMVPIFVCIAGHESGLNTSLAASERHGIFQIDGRIWCSPPGVGCGITCDSLRDEDLTNDVRCALQVYEETQRFLGNGWSAWDSYKHCHL